MDLHTRIAVVRLPLRQLGFLVVYVFQLYGICCATTHGDKKAAEQLQYLIMSLLQQ